MSPTDQPLRRTEFIVLSVLVDRTLHGYGIVGAVEERSGGDVKLRPTNLYRILDRLTHRGLLEETSPPAGSSGGGAGPERSRCFRATAEGRRRFAEEAALLQRLIGGAAESER